jgi:hypothetical protein
LFRLLISHPRLNDLSKASLMLNPLVTSSCWPFVQALIPTNSRGACEGLSALHLEGETMRFNIKQAMTLLGTITMALTFLSCSAAHGQSRAGAERRLTGTVLDVNLATRTILVKDDLAGTKVRVFVPMGRQVALSHRVSVCGGCSSVEIERVLRGMIVDTMVTTQAAGRDESHANWQKE